jgi:hypothetical protein
MRCIDHHAPICPAGQQPAAVGCEQQLGDGPDMLLALLHTRTDRHHPYSVDCARCGRVTHWATEALERGGGGAGLLMHVVICMVLQ